MTYYSDEQRQAQAVVDEFLLCTSRSVAETVKRCGEPARDPALERIALGTAVVTGDGWTLQVETVTAGYVIRLQDSDYGSIELASGSNGVEMLVEAHRKLAEISAKLRDMTVAAMKENV